MAHKKKLPRIQQSRQILFVFSRNTHIIFSCYIWTRDACTESNIIILSVSLNIMHVLFEKQTPPQEKPFKTFHNHPFEPTLAYIYGKQFYIPDRNYITQINIFRFEILPSHNMHVCTVYTYTLK